MPPSLVIFGCGGHGREIASFALSRGSVSANGTRILGFIDDDPSQEALGLVRTLGLSVLGTSLTLARLPKGATFIIGIADGATRQRLAKLAEAHGMFPTSLQHPQATVGQECHIGPGAVLWPGARLTTNVVLAQHVHVNQNVTIGHDSAVGEFTTINPLAAISGNVRIGRRCLIGAGAVILQGLRVGDDSVVGASACVTHDLESGRVVKGVPAR